MHGRHSVAQLPVVRRRPIVDPAEIRSAFRAFLGDERYRKFVSMVPSTSDGTRLKFWQENAWESFAADHPRFDLDFAGIVDVFRVCELHGHPLTQRFVPVQHGCVDFAPEYWQTRNVLHPNSPMPFVATEGHAITETEFPIWFCTECEQIEIKRQPQT